jgi:hypothetical protein
MASMAALNAWMEVSESILKPIDADAVDAGARIYSPGLANAARPGAPLRIDGYKIKIPEA